MMTFYSNLNFPSKKLAQIFFQKNIFLSENLNFPDWSNCHSGMFWKYSEKQESVLWVSKMNLKQWWMHNMVSKASIMDFVPKNLSSILRTNCWKRGRLWNWCSWRALYGESKESRIWWCSRSFFTDFLQLILPYFRLDYIIQQIAFRLHKSKAHDF